MKRFTLPFLLLLSIGLLLSGCSATQKGAAAGGLAGAAIGGAWGYNAATALTTSQAALIGGGAGVAGGALIGDQFDQKNARDSKRDMENLRAQLQDREGTLAAKESELSQLRAGNDPRVSELQAQADQLRASLNDLSAKHAEASAQSARLASVEQEYKDTQERAAKLAEENAEISERLRDVESQLAQKEAQLTSLSSSVQEKSTAVQSLRDQLQDLNVQLDETNRGLTMTILDQLLYAPGKAQLSPEGKVLIGKVAAIIQREFPGREIIVEGHTDNQPIRHSSWASNWELSSARAVGIVHVLVGDHGFDPAKISGMSFGEFRPAASNDTAEGRRLNRRSVILILPEKMAFQKQVASASGQ